MDAKEREELRRIGEASRQVWRLFGGLGDSGEGWAASRVPAILDDLDAAEKAHERWEAMARELAVALEGGLITHCGTNARDDAERNAGFVLAKFRARAKETP